MNENFCSNCRRGYDPLVQWAYCIQCGTPRGGSSASGSSASGIPGSSGTSGSGPITSASPGLSPVVTQATLRGRAGQELDCVMSPYLVQRPANTPTAQFNPAVEAIPRSFGGRGRHRRNHSLPSRRLGRPSDEDQTHEVRKTLVYFFDKRNRMTQ